MTKIDDQNKATCRQTPWIVSMIIVSLSLIIPLTHYWIMYSPPGDLVPTGMLTGDSGHHILSMRSFTNDFHSPFATCKSELGTHSVRYFAAPLFLLYGVFGCLGHLFGINEFLFLGLLNGVGGACYLIALWRFLKTAVPKYALTAFVLLSLGGGLGGILYLLCMAMGVNTAENFELLFRRYAWYELIEGQHLSPLMLMYRFYYTFPLALGYTALTNLIRYDRTAEGLEKKSPPPQRRPMAWMMCLLFLTTLINLRLGPLFFGIAVVYLACNSTRSFFHKIKITLLTVLPVAAGGVCFFTILGYHPSYQANVSQVTAGVMWLLPFLSATLLLWPCAVWGFKHTMQGMPKWMAYGLYSLAGYLWCYTALYLAYQLYYGNLVHGGDTSAALFASDPALVGFPLGFLFGVLRRRKYAARTTVESTPDHTNNTGWIALWLLLFFAVAVSTWGNGWLTRFTPQRCMIFLGVPLSVMAARGLHALSKTIRVVVLSGIITCGLASIAVASLCFQGPLGLTPGESPFAYLHYEVMTKEDAELVAALPPGTVLPPPWSPIAFGEILALKEDIQVVGGPGAMNIGDQPFQHYQTEVNQFFNAATTTEWRYEFVRHWCVDYLFLPDSSTLDPVVVQALETTSWLNPLVRSGNGVIWEISNL